MIVDLFSGPRGWSEGLRQLGDHDEIGIEWDRDACLTAQAAGHATIRADVEQYPTRPFVGKIDGLIASPPCTDWSTAGAQRRWEGESGRLVLEVARWVRELRPRWVACEQVPPALEVWVRFAHDFAALGYRSWAGILNAADFGVPQTRRRAFLLCSLEREPHPPVPSHARLPQPTMFGEQLLPWVSMANALGWTGEIGYKRGAGMTERHGERPARPTSEPAPTITGSALGAGGGPKMFLRSGSTVAGGPLAERECDEPAFTVTSRTDLWHAECDGEETIRLTIEDALVLQSFRADYPLVGTKTSQFAQVGNAVPPRLAAHVLATLL